MSMLFTCLVYILINFVIYAVPVLSSKDLRQVHGPEQQGISLHKHLLHLLSKAVARWDKITESIKNTFNDWKGSKTQLLFIGLPERLVCQIPLKAGGSHQSLTIQRYQSTVFRCRRRQHNGVLAFRKINKLKTTIIQLLNDHEGERAPGLSSQEMECEEQRKTGGREGARLGTSASVWAKTSNSLPPMQVLSFTWKLPIKWSTLPPASMKATTASSPSTWLFSSSIRALVKSVWSWSGVLATVEPNPLKFSTWLISALSKSPVMRSGTGFDTWNSIVILQSANVAVWFWEIIHGYNFPLNNIARDGFTCWLYASRRFCHTVVPPSTVTVNWAAFHRVKRSDGFSTSLFSKSRAKGVLEEKRPRGDQEVDMTAACQAARAM